MPVETDFQHQIIKAAREQGGHGRKWSSQFQVGVIDLVIALPTIGAVFMEVKREKMGSGSMDRALGVTEKQRLELFNWHTSGVLAVVGLVLDGGARHRSLALLPWYTERYQSGHQPGPVAYGSMPYGGLLNLMGLVKDYKASLADHQQVVFDAGVAYKERHRKRETTDG